MTTPEPPSSRVERARDAAAGRRRSTVPAMSQRDRYEPGVPCWVTTMQPDVEAAAEYYGGLFGWDYEDGGGFLTAKLRGRDVAAVAPLAPGFEPPAPAWLTQVSVETAEGAAERVERAGGRVIAGPLEFEIGRLVVVEDPGGAVFNAWEPRTRHGAQLVNEPGAWAMSQLDTPDPEARRRVLRRACSAGRRSPSARDDVPPARLRRRRAARSPSRARWSRSCCRRRTPTGAAGSSTSGSTTSTPPSRAPSRAAAPRVQPPVRDAARPLGRARRPGRRRRSRSASGAVPAG